jgi:hypothetical protein
MAFSLSVCVHKGGADEKKTTGLQIPAVVCQKGEFPCAMQER